MPKVTCLQGQRLLIGKDICLTVSAIYKKRDNVRCVVLEIETPEGILVFQERMDESQGDDFGKQSKCGQVQRSKDYVEEKELCPF